MVSVSVLFESLAGLFLLLGAGFFAVKARLVPSSGFDPMVALLMKIALPAAVFTALIRPFDAGFLLEGGAIFLLGMVCFPLFTLMALGLSRLLHIPKERRGTWCFCVAFPNCALIGYPVAFALFGEVGLSLAVFFCVAFNLLCFTMGAAVMNSGGTAGADGGRGGKLRAALCTPVNAATLAGLICYCAQISVPQVLMTPLEYLADLTTPLSMFVTGMSLAQGKFGEHIRDREALLASLARLLVCPLTAWALITLLPLEWTMVTRLALVLAATPCAAVVTLMAGQYGGCVTLGARSVFLSSLFCIVTLPVISLLL